MEDQIRKAKEQASRRVAESKQEDQDKQTTFIKETVEWMLEIIDRESRLNRKMFNFDTCDSLYPQFPEVMRSAMREMQKGGFRIEDSRSVRHSMTGSFIIVGWYVHW